MGEGRQEPRLGAGELDDLIALRRDLHRHPELAGREARTASVAAAALESAGADRVVRGLGGHGVLGLFGGPAPGPRVLVRCELDALPVPETIAIDHGSGVDGVAHKCGHDGHMAIVLGVARLLSRGRPAAGEVALLFQPAEETGAGAAAVIADPGFAAFAPDFSVALHNLPGFPAGSAVLGAGAFAAASRGIVIELDGETAHASEPHRGRSPAAAVAELISGLEALPQRGTALHEAAQVTVIHARLGRRAFGTAPGEAVVMATLRAHDQEVVERLAAECSRMARAVADARGLRCRVSFAEEFPATHNDPGVVEAVSRAAVEMGLERLAVTHPFPWSEDFGHFTARWPGALVGLGAGVDHAALHSPGYDFPDELIGTGAALLHRAALGLLRGTG
jgi:amidohydrolase